MAVRKRGKIWVIDYRVNGKKIVRAVGPCKRDAVAAEGKIKAQIREGRFFDCKPQVRTTIGELIQRLKDRLRQRLLQRGVLLLERSDFLGRGVPLRIPGRPFFPASRNALDQR